MLGSLTLKLRERAAADLSLLRGERELPTRRIADLGCGTGPTARAMAAAFPGAEVIVGVDTSVEMLGVAKVLSAEQQASAEAKAEAATTSVSVGASRAPHLRLSAAGDVGDVLSPQPGAARPRMTASRPALPAERGNQMHLPAWRLASFNKSIQGRDGVSTATVIRTSG